jgi:hypothetical protein
MQKKMHSFDGQRRSLAGLISIGFLLLTLIICLVDFTAACAYSAILGMVASVIIFYISIVVRVGWGGRFLYEYLKCDSVGRFLISGTYITVCSSVNVTAFVIMAHAKGVLAGLCFLFAYFGLFSFFTYRWWHQLLRVG